MCFAYFFVDFESFERFTSKFLTLVHALITQNFKVLGVRF